MQYIVISNILLIFFSRSNFFFHCNNGEEGDKNLTMHNIGVNLN